MSPGCVDLVLGSVLFEAFFVRGLYHGEGVEIE